MKQVMQPTVNQLKLRVLLLKDGEFWVAQCLEFDLAAQGSTIAEAQQSFVRTFVMQALVDSQAGKQPFADFKPAPAWYAMRYDEAQEQEFARPLSLDPAVSAFRAVAEVRLAA